MPNNLEINWRYLTTDDFRRTRPPERFRQDENDDTLQTPAPPTQWACIPCGINYKTEYNLSRHEKNCTDHQVKLRAWKRANGFNIEDEPQPEPQPEPILQNEELIGDFFGNVVEVLPAGIIGAQENFEFLNIEETPEFEDILNIEMEDFFDFDGFYKSNSPITIYERVIAAAKPQFATEKTKEFCQLVTENSITEKGRLDLMKFFAKWAPDRSIPTSKYFLDGAIEQHFPQIKIFQQECEGETLFFHSIQEILESILDSNFVLHFWFEEKEVKSQENHFEAWKELQHPTKKTLFLKLFLDKYEITSRNGKQANGCYLTLGNFKPVDQRSIETKYILSIFPPEKDPKWSKSYTKFFWFVFNVFIVQLQELERTGLDYNGENYAVKLYCLYSTFYFVKKIGDYPGQCEAAGVTGHYASKMPNLKCTGDILCGEHLNPCVTRDPASTFTTAAEGSTIEWAGVWGTLTQARDRMNAQSLTYPVSPFWLVLKERYFERFGICRMHLMYEGVGPLILSSMANEHGDAWVERFIKKFDKLSRGNKFGLTDFYWKTKNKATKVEEWKVNMQTAREKKFALFVAWSLLANDASLSDVEKEIFHLFLQIVTVLCQESITDQQIENLRWLCSEFYSLFQEKYNDSNWTNTKRCNIHSMIHIADTVKYLGLFDEIDTVYHEVVHGDNKKVTSNNKQRRRDIMVRFNTKRTHQPADEERSEFHVASHCCVGRCSQLACFYKKMIFKKNHKIVLEDMFKIESKVSEVDPVIITYGQLKSIHLQKEGRILRLDFIEYQEVRRDQFDQVVLERIGANNASWGPETMEISITKLSVGKIQNNIFVSKFWSQEHEIKL